MEIARGGPLQPNYQAELQLAASDFWLSSGHVLLDITGAGRLAVSDAFIKAYFARPELLPPPEACDAERALHARLMHNPKAAVDADDISAMADDSAQENWRVMLEFRDALVAAGTLENAYIRLVKKGLEAVPPLFLSQLVHAIARQALATSRDALVLRAAEILFRTQEAAIHDRVLMLADAETIAQRRRKIAGSPLLTMFGGETAHMDILGPDNAHEYWRRSDRFDFILTFGTLKGGRAAFAQALTAWIAHLFGVEVEIEPVQSIEDRHVRWILGLDAQATALGNAIWSGHDLSPEDLQRLIAIFRIGPDPNLPFKSEVSGHPVYLLLAMGEDRSVRVKPQNLVAGLPWAEGAI